MRLFAGTQWDQPPKCDRCGKLVEECQCEPLPPPPAPQIPPAEQTARLTVEKRRKGKVVTLIRGLPSVGNDLPTLLTRLKSECGVGGTLRDDELELQGDLRERASAVLTKIGYRVK
ncbi:MAG: translation initiation factor [Planctomycetales bacterium]|nr:translation initiation factor [Planctomycetales bacterium]